MRPRTSTRSAWTAPSKWPVSPTLRRATRMSPRRMPSSCSSPSPSIEPSIVRSADSSEATFGVARRVGSAGLLDGRAAGASTRPAALGPDLACLLNILTSPQEAVGVLGLAIDPDFVMQVRTGGAARRTHRADARADRHPLADADADRGQVRVASLEAAAVIDLDGVAVAGADACERHDARRRGHDRRAHRAGEIEPRVEGGTVRERIEADAVARGQRRIAGRLVERQLLYRRAQAAHVRHVVGGVLDTAGE